MTWLLLDDGERIVRIKSLAPTFGRDPWGRFEVTWPCLLVDTRGGQRRTCWPVWDRVRFVDVWNRVRRVALRPVILAIALTPLIFSIPAQAQDDGRWIRQSLKSSCEWWENCPRYRWRYVRARHIELRRVYRDSDGPQQCRDFVTAVGEERYGRERAKEAAEATWMEAVRARYGTKWMDLRNSRGGTWECGRSSTGNRASEKAQDMVGKYLEQCELRSRPCRAELERVNKD